jgi:hypothetical protein
VFKWVGTGLCVLIAGAFVVSVWWTFGYAKFSASPVYQVAIMRGVVFGNTLDPSILGGVGGASPIPDGWFRGINDKAFDRSCIWPKRFYRTTPKTATFVVPLWLPFLALLLPTLLLWRLDRRRPPPGHCRCGYNLTGLTSGRCPECGTSVMEPRSHAAT